MLRFLMTAMFFLGSIHAEESNVLNSDPHAGSCHKCQTCKSPRRGPPGPQGVPGANGADGPAGPEGPPGAPSGDALIPYATGDQIWPITGVAGDVYTLNYNETGTPFPPLRIVNGVITQPDADGNDVSFSVPEDRVISALAASFTYSRDRFSNPAGIAVNMTAEVWIAPPESPTTFTFSGVRVTFPTFTTPATVPPLFLNAGPATFNVPVRGGSRIILLYTAVSSEPLASSILGTASAGLRL